MRYVLVGDGESPHLLKWARALAALPQLDLWVASSRGFAPGFDAVLPATQRLALDTRPNTAGGNLGLLRHLPRLSRWLKQVDAPWVHAHYLTSHGTLVWLARRFFGVRGLMVASAWGSDVLVTPGRSAAMRWALQRVLRDSALCTSDSRVMAQRMQALGAAEVMVFPFGLQALPAVSTTKDDQFFFSNRALEPLYAPERVLALFAALNRPQARLVVANDGSLLPALKAQAASLGIAQRVQFVGRLDAVSQAVCYDRARWYISLPRSDSVAVSVLEAMAHGCVPVLSDLPANRELVDDGHNGVIVADGAVLPANTLAHLLPRADKIASDNRNWVETHALFQPCVARFMSRLKLISPAAFAPGPRA